MRLVSLLLPLALTGCYVSHDFTLDGTIGEGDAQRPDGARADGRVPMPEGGFDAGRLDAGRLDAGRLDAGRLDAGRLDAGFDAGRRDAGFDAGRRDAGLDAGRRDAGFDAGRRDAGLDAGRRDAGLDAGRRDAGFDAGRDAGRDAGFDAGRDAGLDSGPRRPALRFAVDDFLDLSRGPSLDLVSEATIEMWARLPSAGLTGDFCSKGDVMAMHLRLGVANGRLTGGWQVDLRSRIVIGPVLPTGRWVHVAMVQRPDAAGRTSIELFVDGASVAVQSFEPDVADAINTLPLMCGRMSVDLDEIRLWRLARRQVDIAANRNNRIAGSTPGLVGYWRLDENGQLAIDYSTNGLTGVLGRFPVTDAADPLWIPDGAL